MFYSFFFLSILVVSIQSLDGGWSDYSLCTKSCGQGTQLRTCTNPLPDGGNSCIGSPFQFCNTDPCPVDGQWTNWTPCTKSCGGGEQQRRCSPFPSSGGLPCFGDPVQRCNTFSCTDPIINGGWGPFSECSTYCGIGMRTRICNNPPPSNGGFFCMGPATMPCNLRDCPYPAQVTFLLETPFPFQFDQSSIDPNSPSNQFKTIVQTDMQEIFQLENWINTEIKSIDKSNILTKINSLSISVQLLVTGQWTSNSTPLSPLAIGQKFKDMVVKKDDFIYNPERRISQYINESVAPSVQEIIPPYKFTFVWWMWVVVGGSALVLCVIVSILKRYFCNRWCEPDFEAELAAVNNKNVDDLADGDQCDDVPRSLPDTPSSLAHSLQSNGSSSMPSITPQSSHSTLPSLHYPNLSTPSFQRRDLGKGRMEEKYDGTHGLPFIPEGSNAELPTLIPTVEKNDSGSNTPLSTSRDPSPKISAKSLLAPINTKNTHNTRKIRTSSFEDSPVLYPATLGSQRSVEVPSPSENSRTQQFSSSSRIKFHFSPSLPRINQTPSPVKDIASPTQTSPPAGGTRSPPTSPSPTSPTTGPEWEAHWDENHGAYYYYNINTGQSVWQLPAGGRMVNVLDTKSF